MIVIADRPSVALLRRPLARIWPGDPVLCAIVAVVFAIYATLSLALYLTGDPASYDTAIFTEAVRAYAHLQAPVVSVKGEDLLGDHFSPAIAVMAPLFRLFPTAATLLVIQAALSALSVIPVYRGAAHLLSRGEARLIAGAYALSWGLVDLAWFDFHEVALAVPLIACSVSAMVRGRHRAAIWWAVPLVWVKEDLGFTVAALGGLLALVYGRRLAGALLAVWALAWSLLAIYVIIPAFSSTGAYAYWRDAPHAAALTAGWAEKGPMLAMLVLPSAGLALRSPLVLAAVPATALRLVSSNPGYWGTGRHYSATVMPILFIAAVDGLARIRRARIDGRAHPLGLWLGQHGAAVMAAVAVALAIHGPIADLRLPGLYRTPQHIAVAARAERMIPDGQTVAASMGQLAPLAARTDVCYLTCRTAPQWILLDQGAGEWWHEGVQPAAVDSYPGATYRTVYSSDGVWLLKRVG